MSTISVNGQTYECPDGATVDVNNNKVFINGKEVSGTRNGIEINIQGNISALKVERGPVNVRGDCGRVDAGGSITVTGSVDGKVDAGGNVTCGNVGGNIDAGGNVVCAQVQGNVDAGGNVMMAR